MLDEERLKSELALTSEKVRGLEDQLRTMRADHEQAQTDLAGSRDSVSRLELRISELTSELSEAAMYKEMYERAQREFETEQRSFGEQLNGKDKEIIDLNEKITKHQDEIYEYKE